MVVYALACIVALPIVSAWSLDAIVANCADHAEREGWTFDGYADKEQPAVGRFRRGGDCHFRKPDGSPVILDVGYIEPSLEMSLLTLMNGLPLVLVFVAAPMAAGKLARLLGRRKAPGPVPALS